MPQTRTFWGIASTLCPSHFITGSIVERGLVVQDVRTHHPQIEKLTAFGLGHLSEVDSQGIELHLANCEACRQKLVDVPDDALVRLLQASAWERPAPAAETQTGLSGLAADTDAATRSPESPSDTKAAPVFALPRELEGHARYHVLGPLGAGGMGTVYKARHRMMDRVVALKIVNPQLISKPGALERFTREVRAAAQLVHPNIVTAYDAEAVGGLHLLVMEYIEGQTLAQVLAEQHELPIAQACDYLRQTALGLQHALDRGMVHRDIKPQNLMLVSQERSRVEGPESRAGSCVVKILDFGLARFVSEQTRSDEATEQGMLMGSLDYMAPEQGRDAHAADARADIYSMGCTLYHLLAGQIPFPATSLLEKLESHRDKQPRPLHHARPAVPIELSKVVAKMMAKDPAQRYQTPAEVALALQPFTQAEPAPVPRAGSGDPRPALCAGLLTPHARPAPRLSRARQFVLAVCALLLIALIGYWAAPLVFRVETPHGTLIVKTDDPDVQISVKSGGTEVALFFPKQKKEIPLKVGQYTIELVGGQEGLKLSTNKFEIKSASDQKTVSVEFVPAAVAGKGPNQETAKEPDRQAADYVLSIGGKVHVNEQDQEITVATDLPGESFRLTAVNLGHNKRVSDVELIHFKGCKYLTQLVLGSYLGDSNVDVRDTGLAYFKDCKDLTFLSLGGTQVSDAGLGFFKNCKKLTYLHLDSTKVGDDGLAHFKDMNLSALSLCGTQVTDAGLAHFKDWKNLYWLWLGDTKVSDAALVHFKDCKELRYLILSKTQVSDAGLAHLKDCKNLIQLLLDSTKVSDAGLAHFQEFENVTGLNLANTRVSDAGLAHFKNCKKMKHLWLENTQVSDAGLAHIKDFINLETLTLKKTKVTAAGIAELKKALPQCQIEWDGGMAPIP